MDAELRIRKRILSMCGFAWTGSPLADTPRSYNRRRDDFPTECAYNDFLEETEDISAQPGSELLARALTPGASLQPEPARGRGGH